MSKNLVVSIEKSLTSRIEEVQEALGSNQKAEKFKRSLVIELKKNPALLKCDPVSVLGSAFTAASLGLEFGNFLGQAYLVPFKGQCQLMPGYRGYLKLLYNSPLVKSITCETAHENDEFTYKLGTNQEIHHVPASSNRGPLTHAYAIVSLQNGGSSILVMNRDEIQKHRQLAGKDNIWKAHYEEMAKKTVIRKICKYLPLHTELQSAIGMDDLVDGKVDQGNRHNVPDSIEADFQNVSEKPTKEKNEIDPFNKGEQ